MPVDAPVIARLAVELNRILPLKISKIYQPYPDEFVFTCFGAGENFKLLFSVNSRYGRFHLFDGQTENPATPSAFCMLLRKHFGGGKLTGVKYIPFERITCFSFETFDPLQGLGTKNLLLEMTGKNGNLILTSATGAIIDLWRKSGGKENQRDLTPGSAYQLPPTGGRWQPVTLSRDQFTALLQSVPGETPLESFFLKHWYGISPLMLQEICGAAGLITGTPCGKLEPAETERLYYEFSTWADTIARGEFQSFALYGPDGTLLDCSGLPLRNAPEGLLVREVPSMHQTVAGLIGLKHETDRFQELKNNLTRRVRQTLEKNRTKQAKQEAEAAAAEQSEELRIAGELLTIYGYRIGKGESAVALENHYEPGTEMTVVLNPALSAQENAQFYYKKYQKAKKGQQAIAAQLAKTNDVISYYESVLVHLEQAMTPEDLKLIREELDPEPVGIKTKRGRPQETKGETSTPRRFESPSGHVILVGKNNLQNDRLTFKIAGPADIWLHTQKIPGSHVIIKLQPGLPLDDETLNMACQLAVFFSRARNSTKVPVDYTERKHVKKPPESKPGFVIYHFFKTAIITPKQEILKIFGL